MKDQNFWIFLCFGQSNMAGQAPIEQQDLTVVPLLVGEVVRSEYGGICGHANPTINDMANRYPNTYIVSSEGCLPCYDYLHFSGEGYRLLGRHYAQRYLEVIKNHQT